MRAVWFEKKGPAHDVLMHGELPAPAPGVGEVRVRVQVSGLNPTDTKTRGGWLGNVQMPFPRMIVGQDGAGVVDAVGPGVPDSRLGQRVWVYEACLGRPFGTQAEFVVVPSVQAVLLPPGIDLDTGAGLGVPALTAHRCLFMDGPIHGRTVLVQGGGGGVGHAAIQLAHWAGARVIATVSRPEQQAAALQAGAHLVVNRKSQPVVDSVLGATGGRGVDRIIEVAFDQNISQDADMLAVGGAIATYAAGPAPQPAIPFFTLMRKSHTVHYVLVYTMGDQAHRDAVRDVTACLEAGQFRTHVGARFPLEQAADAHQAQDSGTVVGKILLDIP
jgi:NADPH2:quinone reductase